MIVYGGVYVDLHLVYVAVAIHARRCERERVAGENDACIHPARFQTIQAE